MNAKEALKRIVKRANAYGWATENIDDEIIVMNALHRLEELEKFLEIIKEYILKDMTVFASDSSPIVYLQFKCGYDSVYYGLPYEKFYEIKEYLK